MSLLALVLDSLTRLSHLGSQSSLRHITEEQASHLSSLQTVSFYPDNLSRGNGRIDIEEKIVLGIVLAYWVDFGVRNAGEQFRWRFPLAFMTLPSIIILLSTALLPDSPRWLMANDREDEAVEVLAKLRGDLASSDTGLVEEVARLKAIVEASHKRNNFLNLVVGRYSGRLHLGRRVWMGFVLQQITCFTGIMAIATYAGNLFAFVGFDAYKSSWLAGLVNTFGVFGTAAAVSSFIWFFFPRFCPQC